ncbi:putative membrane protein, partial [Vibrio harveyi]
MFQNASLF